MNIYFFFFWFIDDSAFEQFISSQESEMILLLKWRELIDGLLPPSGTRGRRFCFAGSKNSQDIAHTQYTLRQLEYVGLLLKKMLKVKHDILQVNNFMVCCIKIVHQYYINYRLNRI